MEGKRSVLSALWRVLQVSFILKASGEGQGNIQSSVTTPVLLFLLSDNGFPNCEHILGQLKDRTKGSVGLS